jgi:hypothetical protein
MPDEITRQRLRLARALRNIFEHGEDAVIAEAILMAALRAEFGHPIKEEDRSRFMAALELLPKGSTAQPRLLFVRPLTEGTEGAGLRWRATFTDSHVDYESSRRFATEDDANAWASDFLIRLRGEINKP